MQAFSFKFHKRILLEKQKREYKSNHKQRRVVWRYELWWSLGLKVKKYIYMDSCILYCSLQITDNDIMIRSIASTVHSQQNTLPNLSADAVKKQSSTGLIAMSTTLEVTKGGEED